MKAETSSQLTSQSQQSIFHEFYIKLKSEASQPVRRTIEVFVKDKLVHLKTQCTREEQGIQVQDLMTDMTEQFIEAFPPAP